MYLVLVVYGVFGQIVVLPLRASSVVVSRSSPGCLSFSVKTVVPIHSFSVSVVCGPVPGQVSFRTSAVPSRYRIVVVRRSSSRVAYGPSGVVDGSKGRRLGMLWYLVHVFPSCFQ